MSAQTIGVGFRRLALHVECVRDGKPAKLIFPLVNFVVTHHAEKKALTIAQETPVKCDAVSGVESVVSFAIREE